MVHRLQHLVLAALAIWGVGVVGSAADEVTAWRLFVSDHTEPVVTAIDLPNGESAGAFTLEGPASLYVTGSKTAVYAVQTNAGRVSAITTGIEIDDHGDHGDIEVSPPHLIEASLLGERPVHFVEHAGDIAVFFDGEGRARVLSEKQWLAGDVSARDYPTAAPHHGVAAPFDGHILISAPNSEDAGALPVGIEVLTAAGQVRGDLSDCPDLHGEASSGHKLVIACATGLLVVREGSGGPDIAHLPYSPTLPDGKTTTLLGGVGLQYWLGNYGADRVVIIDPSDAEPFRLVNLPSRRVHFAVDPVRPKFAYIFTEDGQLHALDILSGGIVKSLQVTEPYSMDGEWNLPRPRIAVAGDVVAVTDPLQGAVHLVDAENLTLARDIAVEGMPYNIVAVGGSGEQH